MKLYIVTKKLSAKLASETEFYIDFKPLTFEPFLKKTLYNVLIFEWNLFLCTFLHSKIFHQNNNIILN